MYGDWEQGRIEDDCSIHMPGREHELIFDALRPNDVLPRYICPTTALGMNDSHHHHHHHQQWLPLPNRAWCHYDDEVITIVQCCVDFFHGSEHRNEDGDSRKQTKNCICIKLNELF